MFPVDKNVDYEDDESIKSDSTTEIIYIVLAGSGSLLLLVGFVAFYLWKIDRNKTKKLTKNRVSLNYKYEPMGYIHRPSIITDPRVTNDLE